jgi:PAS domain S-box-containing protein
VGSTPLPETLNAARPAQAGGDGGPVDTIAAQENERRMGEASFRGLFDGLSELVYVQDFEGRFIDVNEAVLRSYGYERDELIGQVPAMLGAPGLVDVEDVMRRFEKAVEGEPQRFDWWGRRKDGSIFPKEVTLKRSTYFGRDVILAVARDISERLGAEAALRRSEEYFRRLIEHASDLISILDIEGIVRYESPAITRMLGYQPEELMGENAFAYICEDDLAHVLERFQEVMEHPGRTVAVEFRFRHKDGSWVYMESTGRTLDPESPESGIVVNSRDITGRKLAEAALRESEEHFRRLIENSSDVAVILNSDGIIEYQSPAITRVLGYEASDMLGRTGFEYIHQEDVPAVRETLEAILATPGSFHPAQFRYRHRDGSWRVLETIGRTLLPDSAAGGIVVNARDVTERVVAERQLRLQKTMLEAQGEASIDGIIVVADDGTVMWRNARFAEMWGLDAASLEDGVVGPLRQALLGRVRDPEGFLERVTHLYANPGEEARDELELADGRTFDRYTSPLCGPENEYYGRIWFFRDITETRRHTVELEAARAEAEAAREKADEYAAGLEVTLAELRAAQLRLVQQEKMASMGRLTAGIAHEIRNPLNFITNFSKVNAALVDDLREAIEAGDGELAGELIDDLAQNASKVHEHGSRADAIVRGMMDHARAGQEPDEPRRELDVHFLIDQHIGLIHEARAPGSPAIVIERAYGADEPRVHAVQADVDRVIRALLSNAVEAVDERAGRDGDGYAPCVTVTTRRDGASFTVLVADNGPGVAEDVKPRVFEPFFTTKPSGSGHTGLGLSLAHETVVNGYGGWMEVESTPGEGAAFWFCLPV